MGTAISETAPKVDALVREAERAGYALACPFSSSAEFDAAIIRARRAAGAYGPKRHRRGALLVIAFAVAVAALTLAIAL